MMSDKAAGSTGAAAPIVGTPAIIIQTNDWVILTCTLETGSSGSNYLHINRSGTGMIVPPGGVVGPMLLPPGTFVKVSTTHTSFVNWGYQVTTLPSVFASLVEQLPALIDAIKSLVTVVGGTEKKLEKLGGDVSDARDETTRVNKMLASFLDFLQ